MRQHHCNWWAAAVYNQDTTMDKAQRDTPSLLRWGLAILMLCCLVGLAPAKAASERLRIGIPLEPASFDITTTAASTASEITYANVFEGLTIIDGQGQIKPRLAQSWTVSKDGKQVDVVLRRHVRYHDGKPFNAATAVFSLQRLLQMKNTNAYLEWFDKFASVEATGEYQLRIHLSEPDALLSYALAMPGAVMVHPDSAATNASAPVGTGPYQVDKWTKGKSITLLRNEQWWDSRKPAIRLAEFLFMSSAAETENMLAEGRIDALSSVTRLTASFMTRTDYVMGQRGVEGKLLIAMNNGRAPLNDIRVRRAINHAIDRSRYQDIYGGSIEVLPIGSHFSPHHPAYVDLVQRYPYDTAQAKALLAQAGVAPGTTLRLAAPPTDYGRYGSLVVATQLEAIGFQVEIIRMDWPTWLDQVMKKKDYDLSLIMHVEPMDIGIYARDDYYFNYNNRVFKKIWEKLRASASPRELDTWLVQAQKQLAEDAVNAFIVVRPERNFMRKGLVGMWSQCPIPTFALEDLRWQN